MSMKAINLLGLVPSVLCENTTVDVMDASELYKTLLPSPELLPTEIIRYKVRYMKMQPDNRPATCAAAMKDIDPADFPNIATLLQIACTLPVSSCECERSASVLRRLHSWMRASMGQDRLGSLALIHIHYNADIDLDKVVDVFARKHPRRMQLNCVLTD